MREASNTWTEPGHRRAPWFRAHSPANAAQRLRLHQHVDDLFEKERGPLGAADDERFQVLQPAVGTEPSIQVLLHHAVRQRLERDVSRPRMSVPRITVVETVRRDEEQRRVGESLNEGIDDRLCLGIGPVQILDEHDKRLDTRGVGEQCVTLSIVS